MENKTTRELYDDLCERCDREVLQMKALGWTSEQIYQYSINKFQSEMGAIVFNLMRE